ncbi:MAG: hypothetical protein HGA39_09330 [Coriobacteriia bacterium]|nr:hypothetical protein [Coriobacteriia bacterium]
MNRLDLTIARRSAPTGLGVEYMDFVIDDTPLRQLFSEFDHVSCIARFPVKDECIKAASWLLPGSTDYGTWRCSMYVCGECGDPECGEVSVCVTVSPNTISWHSFAFDTALDGQIDEFDDVGPFEFDRAAYSRCIERGIVWLRGGS